PSGLPFAASVAKVAAVNAAWHVAASALQVPGGMGFPWEHPIHLFLRRASASSRLLGSADQHLDRVAGLTGLGESDHRTAEAALPAATDGAAAMSRHGRAPPCRASRLWSCWHVTRRPRLQLYPYRYSTSSLAAAGGGAAIAKRSAPCA